MSSGATPFKKPQRLGRGLSSLVGTNPPVQVDSQPKTEQIPDPAGTGVRLVSIPVDRIVANPGQPRRVFEEAALQSLAESIRRDGVMQPVVVREVGGQYELVAGERRLRASRLAGLETVPAIVRDIDDRTSAELALIENLQRADLNPVERAGAFRALADRYGLTHAEIAERVGLDRASVSNHLRLLDLDAETLEMVADGRLGFGHARALLGVADPERRRALAAVAAEESWSVRAIERACADVGTADEHKSAGEDAAAPKKPAGAQPTTRARAVLDDMERRLGEHLGTRVTLRTDRSGRKGTLTLEFYGLDQFDGLLERLGFRHDVS